MGIDIACAVVLIFAFYRGFRQGMIMAVFSVIAYIVGVLASLHLSFVVAGLLSDTFNTSSAWLPLLAFALTFALAVLIVRGIGKLIERGMKHIFPTSFNRFLGSLIYIFFALILLSLLFAVAKQGGVLNDDTLARSFMVPHLETFSAIIQDNVGEVIPWVEHIFEEMNEYFEGAGDRIEV